MANKQNKRMEETDTQQEEAGPSRTVATQDIQAEPRSKEPTMSVQVHGKIKKSILHADVVHQPTYNVTKTGNEIHCPGPTQVTIINHYQPVGQHIKHDNLLNITSSSYDLRHSRDARIGAGVEDQRVGHKEPLDTITKTPKSASLPSLLSTETSSSQQSSPSKVLPKRRKLITTSEATPQLSTSAQGSLQQISPYSQHEQLESPITAFRKLKETTRKLYDPKFDVDVSKFDFPALDLPNVYPELLSVDFYEGRLVPSDDQYDSKPKQTKFTQFDKKVTVDQLIFKIKTQNFISIVGYPGAGKTTLSKRLARNLDQNGDFLVLWIPFMNMSDCDDDQLTLKEFLLGDVNYNLEEEETNLVFDWIKKHPQNCFFILDGFDQVNWNLLRKVKKSNYDTLLTHQELVSNLCQGFFLRNCHIAFTSRPHAMIEIPQKCRPMLTYFICDLSTENMKILFDALINNEQKSSEIWHALTVKTPHLKFLCHNPLMLQLYLRALSSSHEVEDVSTMTRIFRTVLENLKASGHAVTLTDEIVIKLSKVAFKTTKNETVLITTEDLLNENLSSPEVQDIVVTLFGSNKSCGLLEGNRRLYFTHQTFQEFFSALYITHQMSIQNFTSFVQRNLLGDHWSVVIQFLSGLLLDPCMNKGATLQKREIFTSVLRNETQEVARGHKDDRRFIITLSKILRESCDEKTIKMTGSCFDEGKIKMRSSDSQNDFHAVTSFMKSMPARIGFFGLYGCRMNSNEFHPWVEAINSMPGSIVRLGLRGNCLSTIDDVIKIFHKVQEEVWMWDCLDDGRGWWRSPEMEERAKLQEALNELENKKLWIVVGRDDQGNPVGLTHKDRVG